MPIEGFGEVAERLRRSTVQIVEGRRGSGSGVIWDAGGVIVTNAHVASRDRTRVELWDGRSFEGQVTSRDVRRDLAVVKIPADGLPAAAPGDSASLRAGELVVAVGNPLGFRLGRPGFGGSEQRRGRVREERRIKGLIGCSGSAGRIGHGRWTPDSTSRGARSRGSGIAENRRCSGRGRRAGFSLRG